VTLTSEAEVHLYAAIEYARLGLSVLPVWPMRDGRCACGVSNDHSAGKHPIGRLVPRGCRDASADIETLKRWWGEIGDANIGIASGAVSRIVVLDADGPEGKASLFGLGTSALTWLAETGGGGVHQFFRHPGTLHIPSRSGVLPHLDVRADGGYIVAPPSVHSSGSAYRWRTPPSFVGLAPLPDDVLALLLRPRRTASVGDAGAFVTKGRRNDELFRLGLVLARRGMSGIDLKAALLDANRIRCRPPLPVEEVAGIACSVARRPVAVAHAIDCAREAWAVADWPGTSGNTDRFVLRASLDIAAACGKTEVSLSVRTVGEQAGIGHETAAASLKRLCRAGWLTRCRNATASLAAVYRLRRPTMLASASQKPDPNSDTQLNQHDACPAPGPVKASTRVSDFGPYRAGQECPISGPANRAVLIHALAFPYREHDVWRYRGLGKVCLTCYAVLREVKEISARGLAALAGRKTVKKYLTTLKTHRLATFTGGLWRPVLVSVEDLDRLAQDLGVAGRGARQKERHRRERAGRDRWKGRKESAY
jgi:hypothetical protein